MYTISQLVLFTIVMHEIMVTIMCYDLESEGEANRPGNQ